MSKKLKKQRKAKEWKDYRILEDSTNLEYGSTSYEIWKRVFPKDETLFFIEFEIEGLGAKSRIWRSFTRDQIQEIVRRLAAELE